MDAIERSRKLTYDDLAAGMKLFLNFPAVEKESSNDLMV